MIKITKNMSQEEVNKILLDRAIARKENGKKYYKDNKDKFISSNEEMRKTDYYKEYYLENRDKILESMRNKYRE